jgi:hypothetical protein
MIIKEGVPRIKKPEDIEVKEREIPITKKEGELEVKAMEANPIVKQKEEDKKKILMDQISNILKTNSNPEQKKIERRIDEMTVEQIEQTIKQLTEQIAIDKKLNEIINTLSENDKAETPLFLRIIGRKYVEGRANRALVEGSSEKYFLDKIIEKAKKEDELKEKIQAESDPIKKKKLEEELMRIKTNWDKWKQAASYKYAKGKGWNKVTLNEKTGIYEEGGKPLNFKSV